MPERPSTIRWAALLGIGASLLFWASVFGFAALRPAYSHATKAVSELGAWGAPNMWGFSILGYVLPGLMLAACGWSLGRRAGGRVLASLLALSGLGMAISGVFPADIDYMGSLTTIGHVVGNTASLITWVIAMILAAWSKRKTWPALAGLSALALALMVGAFFLYETLLPGIVQRITFAIFFGYFLVAALLLWRRGNLAAA